MAAPTITKDIDVLVAGWRCAIEAVRANHKDITRLQDVSLRFIETEWPHVATRQHWGELELWGMFDGALDVAKRRVDAMGLVPTLVLGMPVKLERIMSDGALMRGRATGSLLRWRRALTGERYSRSWWDVFS